MVSLGTAIGVQFRLGRFSWDGLQGFESAMGLNVLRMPAGKDAPANPTP